MVPSVAATVIDMVELLAVNLYHTSSLAVPVQAGTPDCMEFPALVELAKGTHVFVGDNVMALAQSFLQKAPLWCRP